MSYKNLVWYYESDEVRYRKTFAIFNIRGEYQVLNDYI